MIAPAGAYARHRLRALGVISVPRGPRPSTSVNRALLTSREREVLGLVAQGLRNVEFATKLFLSEKTVERHLSSVFNKLGVGRRSEAVEAARRVGLVLDPPN